jgi:hypothetical protein
VQGDPGVSVYWFFNDAAIAFTPWRLHARGGCNGLVNDKLIHRNPRIALHPVIGRALGRLWVQYFGSPPGHADADRRFHTSEFEVRASRFADVSQHVRLPDVCAVLDGAHFVVSPEGRDPTEAQGLVCAVCPYKLWGGSDFKYLGPHSFNQ